MRHPLVTILLELIPSDSTVVPHTAAIHADAPSELLADVLWLALLA